MKRMLILLIIVIPELVSAQMLDWHFVTIPTGNKPQVYGSHVAGCMDGGIKLPEYGTGYVLGDVHDNREFGQPELIDYITKLGAAVYADTSRTLIIGDLATARGGPAPITSSLHQSHQTGLDVDIWFRSAKKSEKAKKIKQVSMLDKSRNSLNRNWGADNVEILKDAASFEEVDRIFVNPVIKKMLCHEYAGEAWMNKIRSWWGHSAHFHVRLKCPTNSPDCTMQTPAPKGDGCDEELAWWFSDEAKSGGKKESRKYPVLPKACNRVFIWK